MKDEGGGRHSTEYGVRSTEYKIVSKSQSSHSACRTPYFILHTAARAVTSSACAFSLSPLLSTILYPTVFALRRPRAVTVSAAFFACPTVRVVYGFLAGESARRVRGENHAE
jgi:hypothetical protein